MSLPTLRAGRCHPVTRPLVALLPGSKREVAEPQLEHSNMWRPGSAPKGAMLVVSSISALHRRHFGRTWVPSSMTNLRSFMSQCPVRRVVPDFGDTIIRAATAQKQGNGNWNDTAR